MTKVKVIVLSSGENEVEQCLASVEKQKYVECSVYRIKDLPNREAHEKLYRSIEQDRENFDYFVKVDGDMVFMSELKLSEMIQFVKEQELDHAVFSVFDWYSQTAIMGMHVFSNRCSWPDLGDPLFVDPQPKFPGNSSLVLESPAPIAFHSPNPSLEQAIEFGFHRGLKIVQRDRDRLNFNRALFHYELMKQVYKQTRLVTDPRRKAALYGVECALNTSETTFETRNSTNTRRMLSEFSMCQSTELNKIIDSRWGIKKFSIGSFFDANVFVLWLRYLANRVLRRLRKAAKGV